MPDSKFDLGDYVEVRDRVRIFFELYANGRLTTDEPILTREPDDKPKVICIAHAYRTPDDPYPSTGQSWMYLPGSTSYTKGSELENCQTSAVGRAIGFLGILVDKSIASANEIRAKEVDDIQVKPGQFSRETVTGNALSGKVEIGNASAKTDLELRETPDGHVIGFRLVSPKGGIKVLAFDPLASALALVKDDLVGQRVDCWGKLREETFRPKNSTKDVSYLVLILEKISGPEFILPVEDEPIDDALQQELDLAADLIPDDIGAK